MCGQKAALKERLHDGVDLMRCIGIEQSSLLVYEGDGYLGYGIWPSPTLLPAYIVNNKSDDVSIPSRVDLQTVPYVLWDEGYDPVSRIKKGRIFANNKSQPKIWGQTRHPAQNNVVNPHGCPLITFREFNLFAALETENITDPIIILGTSNHSTIWTIVDAESALTGEVVLYLKSRKVIGALPQIDYSLFSDQKSREHVREKLELLYNELVSAVPDSIVDRCREAASAIGNAYLIENTLIKKAQDLGHVATHLSNAAHKNIAANQASTLAKLHSRTKYMEQANRSTRRVSEQDAEFAVQALGIILIELGYGYW
ncbi:MAG: hypothetical protein MI976_11265 [Pseudomonadales bacterium]|nr:hypothetical protein [Pseudomonadales bacterium]